MATIPEIQSMALGLPAREQLKLAAELLRTSTPAIEVQEVLIEAARRDEEWQAGTIAPLSENEFWSGIERRGHP